MRKPKKRGVKPGTKRGKYKTTAFKLDISSDEWRALNQATPKILTLCDQLEETVTRLENKISNSIARINSLI